MVVVATVVILLWICTHVDRTAGRTMATKRKLTTKTYQEKYHIIKFCEANAMPSLEKYINVDAELGSTQQMTDAEIVDSVKNVSNDTGDVDDVDC